MQYVCTRLYLCKKYFRIISDRMNQFILRSAVQKLPPAYFALPMSTGIISIASYTLGYDSISNFLFVVNEIEMAVLSLALVSRLLFFFKDFKGDLSSHAEGAGFLTFVAALCIYGTKNMMLKNNFTLALTGWCFSFIVWAALIYSFFILITFKKAKPSLENGINGSWLLFVVTSQALSISGNIVAAHYNFPSQIVLFTTLLFYLLGVLFYIIIICLIFYRTAFFPMEPGEFRPSYWINMGAAAISTLSGTILIKSMNGVAEFQTFIPFTKVFTMLFWIVGTWWIPVILFLEVWKRTEIKVRYSAGYWSLVFPLGVYTVCTWQLSDILGLTFLKDISKVFIYPAWFAWFFTYLNMFARIIKQFRLRGTHR